MAVDAQGELEPARPLPPVDARRVHLLHDLLQRRVLQVEREAVDLRAGTITQLACTRALDSTSTLLTRKAF